MLARRAHALLAALLLLAPALRAEPSTPQDARDGFMWLDAPTSGLRIHLDAVLVPDGASFRLFAWFGAWLDCDLDGRIGNAATGLVEYPAALLPKDTPCRDPARVGDGTAREMLWVAPGAKPYGDKAARVFADLALPGQPARQAPKTSPDLVLHWREAPLPLDPSTPAGAAFCASQACGGWWSAPFTLDVAGSPWRARHLTAYGAMDGGFLDAWRPRLPGATGAYGAESCAALAAGWTCDASRWTGEVPLFLAYQLRDVDDAGVAPPPDAERDEDGDGVGDAWNATWRVVDAASDLDQDGASSVDEFRWGTIPYALATKDALRAPDTDLDGWRDGAEIAYWDAHDDGPRYAAASLAGLAVMDPDAGLDLDGDGEPGQLDADADGDGLPDGAELRNGTFPEFRDSDCAPAAVTCLGPDASRYGDARESAPGTGDGLRDAVEVAYWTQRGGSTDCDGDGIPNVRDGDSDADGLRDGEETTSLDPCDADADDDELLDGEERATDPLDPDTDADGMPDGWEVHHFLVPTNASDAGLDPDLDALANVDEWRVGSDPHLRDTDRDGLRDDAERDLGTHPARFDTDEDGMPDGWEVQYGLDPRADDADADLDGDAWDEDGDGAAEYVHANLDEYLYARPYGWREATMGAWRGGTFPNATDTDGDGAGDGAEVAHGTNARSNVTAATDGPGRDPDEDGLTTEEELARGTKPLRRDTDEDGLCDGAGGRACVVVCSGVDTPLGERDVGANALVPDSDGDGLSDGAEACLALSPLDPDTDDDGLSDEEELALGTSGRLADTDADGLTDGEESAWEYDGRRTSPLDADMDDDGASDGDEVLKLGTHPFLRDTDEDGLSDGDERAAATRPLDPDTDHDGMPDGWESLHGLDPRVDDAEQDHDRDARIAGLTNLEEWLAGTRPDLADTDGDSLDDWAEALLGLDPRADDAKLDADGDGLLNAQEYVAGTSPSRPDTDGDGLSDLWETNGDAAAAALGLARSSPNATDTDHDGVDDGRELALWGDLWGADLDGDGGLVLDVANNLRDADADNDGLDDGDEMLSLLTSPAEMDTDHDGATDRDEVVAFATDPRDAASRPQDARPAPTLDADGDGLTDDAERAYGTDPRVADTDHDDLPDGAERVAWGVDWATAYDKDNAPSNLVDPDADDDGIPDGVEFASAGLPRKSWYATSPRDADTDLDGLLDGEEDDNGLVGREAAQGRRAPPTAPLGLAWTGADDVGPYVLGAFGVRLYPSTASADSGYGRQQPRRSAPDATDTDGDLLGDKLEGQRGTLWGDPDTDDDGLTDFIEAPADADGDGKPNGADDDSDNDGLRDDAEDRNRNGRADAGETSLLDADTDEDGLCDAEEKRSSPLDADTDHDGLSDGHEERRVASCLTPTLAGPPKDWTRRDAALPTGRPAWQPWLGPANAPPTANAAGLLPVQTLDFDEDGLIDGLEDWNADGLRQSGETDPALADGDGDGLADGLEVRVWGRMTLATFLQRAAERSLSPDQARGYTKGAWLETDPNDNDTDDDGILDGWDLNPNGLNPARLQLVFDELRMFDPVDPFGDWAPEPYFDITLETAAGTTTLHTPNLPSLPITKGRPSAKLASVLTSELHSALKIDSIGTLSDFRFTEGILSLNIPQDISKYRGAGSGGLSAARITIAIGDADTHGGDLWGGRDASDKIDIGTDTSENRYQVSFALGSFSLERSGPAIEEEWLSPADGSLDSASWTNNMGNAHDDGKLTVRLLDAVRNEFLTQAITVKSTANHFAGPPAGQSWGT